MQVYPCKMSKFLKRLLLAIGWSLILPVLGYVFFSILTIVGALGLMVGPIRLLGYIYEAGLLPTFVTALIYQFFLAERHWALGLALTCMIGTISAWTWYRYFIEYDLLGKGYFTFAIAAATILSVALMPLTTHGWNIEKAKRRQDERQKQ